MHLNWLRTHLLLFVLFPGLSSRSLAQSVPTIVVASTRRDSILKALRIEMLAAGLSFKKLDRDRALFEMDTGRHPARGEIVDVTLEVAVRFAPVTGGTRLEVTETLSAALSTGSERRTPDPRTNWDGYMAILDRTKTRLEQGLAPTPQDSSRHQ
jgi:hypothetical protein